MSTRSLYQRVRKILELAQAGVARTVNTTLVTSNWLIGREIVEEEQRGRKRADYGHHILTDLSARMGSVFGRGYSVDSLEACRRFYLTYPALISETALRKSALTLNSETVSRNLPAPKKVRSDAIDVPWSPGQLHAHLSWSLYRNLLKVAAPEARAFYETEGSRQVAREVEHYNLPAILAVGFRVRGQRGTQFRQWATARLGEYLLKGFVMDDERLKNPPGPGVPDYFDEMLERIRDIRASERRVYLRLRDILALATDYAPSEVLTQTVFQTVQNKLHFAATGHTAPELIAHRADPAKPNMGLTAWKGRIVRKGDVTVAKNYLSEPEISERWPSRIAPGDAA